MAWVCGGEAVLHRAVRQGYTGAFPALRPVLHLWGYRTLWDDLLTVPSSPQLVVVHDAEEVKDLSRLPYLLRDEFDGCYTVFHSNEDDFRRGEDKQLLPGLAALRDSKHGQIIRCCAPASEEDAAAIVASWWPGAGRNVAAALLAEAGSLTRVWQAADKAVRAGIAPDVRAVSSLCVKGSHEDYANQLLAGRRREAMDAARYVSPDEIGGLLALLAARAALLPLVREAAQRRESPQDTVRRLRVDAWVLRQLRPYAPEYSPERIARCRELLAMAETAWRSGSRTGILEAVAALW